MSIDLVDLQLKVKLLDNLKYFSKIKKLIAPNLVLELHPIFTLILSLLK